MISHIRSQQLPSVLASLVALILLFPCEVSGQKRHPPTGGRIAVVLDERLSALRSTPQLSGKLLRRLGRGRLVAIRGAKTSQEGIVFLLVNVTSRTHGWIQREAVISPSHPRDDQKLISLIKSSAEFERVARARVFLEQFPRSPFRSEALLLLADAAEEAAARLSRDAARRIDRSELKSSDAPLFSYFLNYTGLDRYNRQGVGFVFDSVTKQFHYDGSAWREILRRYPLSPEAGEARKRLNGLAAAVQSGNR